MKTEDRFWSKVDPWGPSACWTWTRAVDPNGYGRFWIDGGMRLAHRVAWTFLIGSLDDDLVLDHLCRNPACVNPDHLEPVTQAENIRRGQNGVANRNKTHCPEGHPYVGDNVRVGARGERYCRECNRQRQRRERRADPDAYRARQRKYQARKKAGLTPSSASAA